MTKPEKRWQLLLVADDGRIIPFKHIKGIALTLIILLIIMGLVGAGLAWMLTKEKIRNRQMRGQLASAKQAADRYKSENEIVTAELILAEARMEKAGLPVPDRQAGIFSKKAEQTAPDPQPTAMLTKDEQTQNTPETERQSPAVKDGTPSIEPAKSAIPEVAGTDISMEKGSIAVEPPAVSVGEMKLNHNPSEGRVNATFRVSNTGPRSSPIEGSCLVALKSDPADADTWLGLPNDALVDGKLDPKKGKAFKISRFIDMDMDAAIGTGRSSFTMATVYIFDDAGAILLEKDFPIALKSVPPGTDASVGGGTEESDVALSRFELEYNTSRTILRARFRVNNTGPRSSPIAGRCVVILKNEKMNSEKWLALPGGAMSNGKPHKEQGQPFKISRFKTMEIEASVKTDPSVFDTAVVYIFGMDGDVLLEKAYPIHLSASVP